ncbi:MAG: hypothetical protein J0L92_18450 [Deltaproteobacteria bacterium]|nr:hypothetical protein [Deltaproteobacteria bacterium]
MSVTPAEADVGDAGAEPCALVADSSMVQVDCITRGPRGYFATYITSRPADGD